MLPRLLTAAVCAALLVCAGLTASAEPLADPSADIGPVFAGNGMDLPKFEGSYPDDWPTWLKLPAHTYVTSQELAFAEMSEDGEPRRVGVLAAVQTTAGPLLAWLAQSFPEGIETLEDKVEVGEGGVKMYTRKLQTEAQKVDIFITHREANEGPLMLEIYVEERAAQP